MRILILATMALFHLTALATSGEDPETQSKKFAECFENMKLELKRDPRYIAHEAASMSEEEAQEIS